MSVVIKKNVAHFLASKSIVIEKEVYAARATENICMKRITWNIGRWKISQSFTTFKSLQNFHSNRLLLRRNLHGILLELKNVQVVHV